MYNIVHSLVTDDDVVQTLGRGSGHCPNTIGGRVRCRRASSLPSERSVSLLFCLLLM
jgi:hypothetical protein